MYFYVCNTSLHRNKKLLYPFSLRLQFGVNVSSLLWLMIYMTKQEHSMEFLCCILPFAWSWCPKWLLTLLISCRGNGTILACIFHFSWGDSYLKVNTLLRLQLKLANLWRAVRKLFLFLRRTANYYFFLQNIGNNWVIVEFSECCLQHLRVLLSFLIPAIGPL